MALTPSQRRTREWPLFLLALALVAGLCVPLWQWLVGNETNAAWVNMPLRRWGRLLLGPEQIVCYFCFVWASFILFSRYREVRRQRQAFDLPLLPTDEGSRILHEDARRLQRELDHTVARRGPYILANMIRNALSKYCVSRSSQELAESVRMQAEVDQGRLVTTMATVHYLAWAIPALGFLGTVRGLAGSMSMIEKESESFKSFIEQATGHLTVAFDCTLVALALSLVLMFLLHSVQRDEEALVIDCQQYCLEHLVNRTYEPEAHAEEGALPFPARERAAGHASPPARAGERRPR